ncbi:uncharacterized protein LOC116010813 [Ipomoea triloba]|uniref:uncharacterized protein LOC116010813 n=1 Tax=Ipomoea triloba TaxID=35885 RepID=UPI00125D01FF|nr:uncharacterized protein LOC116010813 [Ipomoea triloba]
MPSQYILASQITPLHTRRAVRVHLVRTYEVPELRGGITSKSKECLFHDEEGTYIHATIPKEDVFKYRSLLIEGKVYSVKNFLVVTNYYTYKTSHHKYIIKFNYKTSVKENTQDKHLKCTIWDDHVAAMVPFFNSIQEEPLIVLIQMCRAKVVNAGCNKKLKSDDKGLLFCEKCKRKWQKGVVRYKVVVRVADAHSDAPFLMWDRECSELLGMPAAELIGNYNEEKDEVPTELETMIGKAMVFKVNIKKENKHIYGSAFTVMRVLRDDSIVTAYCSSLAPDQERDLISKMIEECSDDDSDMEASQGDEVNSPNTACKEIQQEGDNQFSPLTKRCLLDQFSSTHNLKKGKLDSIKKEKIN